MLKKFVVGSVVGLLLMVLVFGIRPVVGYLSGARRSAQKFVAENTPTELDVSRIENIIETEAKKIGDFENEIANLENKISGEQRKVERIETEISNQKEGLAIAKGLIAKGEATYMINGRERTLMEIQSDASARIKYVKTLEAQLGLSQNLIDTLTATATNCRGTLSQARKDLLARQIDLEGLKAREVNAEITAKAASLSTQLMGMSDSILNHSELQEAMGIYENKISTKERQAGQVEQSNSPWIDYSEPAADTDLMSQIDDTLNPEK